MPSLTCLPGLFFARTLLAIDFGHPLENIAGVLLAGVWDKQGLGNLGETVCVGPDHVATEQRSGKNHNWLGDGNGGHGDLDHRCRAGMRHQRGGICPRFSNGAN